MATYLLNADTGADSGTGLVNPWATLAYAYAHSSAGDTLYCQNSTANFLFATATMTDRIIQGQSATGVNFIGSGNVAWSLGGVLTLKTITIDGMSPTTGLFGIAATANVLVTNCIFGTSITQTRYFNMVSATSSTFTLSGNLFKGIKCPTSYYMFFGTTGVSWTLNAFNNTFIMATLPVGYYLVFNSGAGTTTTMNFKNNIIYNPVSAQTSYIAFPTPVGMTLTTTYNDSYQIATTLSGAGNITSDPLFVDLANGNFNLRPTSPCIDNAVII